MCHVFVLYDRVFSHAAMPLTNTALYSSPLYRAASKCLFVLILIWTTDPRLFVWFSLGFLLWCWLRCIYGNKHSDCKTKQSDVGVMPAVCPEPQTAQLFSFRAGMTNASIVGTSSKCFKWCRVESGLSKSPTEVLLVAVLERVTNQPKRVLRTCRN